MISAEIAVSGYFLPPPELPDIPPRSEALSRPLRSLVKLTKNVAEARALLSNQSDRFEAFFALIVQRTDISPDEIEKLAESVQNHLQPHVPTIIEAIRNLTAQAAICRQSDDSFLNGSVLRIAEEGINIAETWMDIYHHIYIRLLKLASERQKEMKPASPVFADSNAAESYLRSALADLDHEITAR